MDYWRKLCEVMLRPQTSEQALVEAWVGSLKEISGWDDAAIEREFPVQVGHETKRGDVMLANAVVIEAKRQGISFNDAHILQQLKSYMRVKYKKFGVLLGSELWLFYDDYADTQEDLKLIGKFDFRDRENLVAGELARILAKNEFSVDKLTEFCRQNWSGKYMNSLIEAVPNKQSTAEQTRKSSEFWTKYWLDFKEQYQAQDDEGILARMEVGAHNDLYASEKVIKELFGRKDGIQWGLAKGNRPNMRKVEVRITKAEVWQRYFAANLAEIVRQIEELGGTYAPKNPEKVINCYFPVADDTEVSYARVFEMYQSFSKIILRYYLGRS